MRIGFPQIVASFAFVMFLLVGWAAAQQPAVTPSQRVADPMGSLVGRQYRNDFLKFELQIPSGWVQMNTSEVDAAKKIGVDGQTGQDAKFNQALEEATNREVIILALGKKPMGSPKNSAMAIGMFKQKSASFLPKMIAEASKSLFVSNEKNKIVRDISIEKIDGKDFATMDLELELYGQKVPMRMYYTMIGSYSISVSMSYSDDESLDAMVASLRTLKFVK